MNKIWIILCLVVVLVSISGIFGYSASASDSSVYKKENMSIDIKSTDEIFVKNVHRVTLITGDVILVRLGENGKSEITILPTDQGSSKSFRMIESPKGTYIFPEGTDLRKLDKELFNIDYLVEESYCNQTDLPVLIDYVETKRERRVDILELRERFGNKVNTTVLKSYRSIPTFSAKISYEGINKTFKVLTERPDVKKIWLDKKVKITLYESVPLTGATELWKSGYNGSGMEIAILDTGIDDTHPDLDDLDNNPSTNDPKVVRKEDFTDDNSTGDLYGHGTHCAGIAAGTGNASTLVSMCTPTPVSTSTLALPSFAHGDYFEHPRDSIAYIVAGTDDEPACMPYKSSPPEYAEHEHLHFEQDVKNMDYSTKETSPDPYEPDDDHTQANWIPVNGSKQTHNFHTSGDWDYLKFDANASINYLIETSDIGSESDTYIYLHDTDGLTEITRDDDGGEGLASRIVWRCDASGTYYIKVRHYSYSACGPDTYYNISVLEGYTPPAEFNDVYSDYGEDTEDDGLYNYLTIDVGVNVTEAGNYQVIGELYENGTYNYVCYAYKSVYLTQGTQTVQFKFDGINIWNKGYNGTFDLKYLHLHDSSTGTQLDYIHNAHTTAYYNYTDFQAFPRYIGVAPGAKLWNIKVLNQYGYGYDSWIIDGIEYAAYGPDGIPNTGDEADIISMSLGGGPTDGTDPLSQAVNDAVDHGLVVVVAAGNSGTDYFTVSSPGAASDVVTVGASTKYDELAWFSSCGPTLDMRVKPDVLAPGVDIIAPRANGTSMGYPINEYYTEASGTSMAAPHVAGAAALMLQAHIAWNPGDVKNALISTADDLGYNVYKQGGGRIYIPSAVNTKILVDPATISFVNSSDKTITFRNIDAVSHTITMDVVVYEALTDNQVDCASLNRTSLDIAPGSSASVLLAIDTTSLPKSMYSGKVIANIDSGEQIHAIFGFSNLNEVQVNKINMIGSPASYDLVVVFSDTEDGWIADGVTDENGTVMFRLPNGTYNIISGWGDIPGASVYTVKENILIEADMDLTLDERDVKIIDFDCNKAEQIISEKYDSVDYNGEYIGIGFGSSRGYTDETKTYITPTNSFNSIFVYSYYPEAYYNGSDRWLVNTPEWHKVLYNLSSVTENVTFVVDYGDLVERTTDYKVALEPEVASWWYHAWHPDMWYSIASIYKMGAPQSRVEWLSPEPISYFGGYEQYTEWWNGTYPDWNYYTTKQKYPAGTETHFALGEHPLKSGAEIYVESGYLEICGYISEDLFENGFKNYSCDVSGNLTIIKDGETIMDHESIRDYFQEYVYFSGMPRFDVIIHGNSSPNLSTCTKTELGFIADPTSDYRPPNITISVVGSDLYNCVTGGDVKLNLTVNDETSIASVNLKYSIDDGSTWDEASIMQINENEWMANIVDLNDSYVSIMANATDSIGNSISHTAINGFYVSSAEECTPPNRSWNITISAANQLEPVTVGMHPNASDGYDAFDVFAQIPVQGKVILLLDSVYSKSVKQTRCYNESASWNLSIGVPSGQTTTLSWDIPSNVNLTIYEGDTILNSGVQLSEGNHSLSVIAELLEKQTFSLNLNAGWNMISLPLVPDNCSVYAIFGSIPTLDSVPVVTWVSPSFVPVVCVEPKIGYWVFTPVDMAINITGTPINDTSLNLKAGWNMVGTVGMHNLTISDMPNQVPERPPVTWVSPSFVETDVIESGKSAWVFVIADTIIEMDKAVLIKTESKTLQMDAKTTVARTVSKTFADEWNFTISATNQLEPVTCGIHPNATNGYDEYDVFAQTPVQGKVILILDDIYATSVNRDKLTWNLIVGVPIGEITMLTWDSSKMPEGIVLTLDGVDMKSQDSIELGEGSHSFVINATLPILGDVNQDGMLSTVDVALVLQMASGNSDVDPAADVNDDGQVTSLDALMILQAAAHAIDL